MPLMSACCIIMGLPLHWRVLFTLIRGLLDLIGGLSKLIRVLLDLIGGLSKLIHVLLD